MPILKVSPIALNQLWKLDMHLTVEVVFILSINNGFWVPGSSMCSFFLGEHIISFIFMMSLQQIFILDILRLRDMIFYKIPLSLLALALVFPLPFPPLQGLNLQGVFILANSTIPSATRKKINSVTDKAKAHFNIFHISKKT